MKNPYRLAVAAAGILALSGCLDVEVAPGGGTGGDVARQYSQVIGFTRSAGGSGQLRQSLQPGAGSPGNARVCFTNNGPIQAALTHGVPNINPLSAAPGGRSCANFPSSSRVAFTLVETGVGIFPLPAQPDRAFVYTMSPFDGGVLSLDWSAS